MRGSPRSRAGKAVPWVLAAAVAVIGAGAAAAPEPGVEGPGTSPERTPYWDLSRSDTGFNGPGRDLAAPRGLASVKLGLLGPAKRPEGERLREGAALAIAEANARGGFQGIPYEAVFRADDGPWGMGAKQVAALACEDSTWGIVGGLDGADAHLAELVAAKLWIPVITPAADDLSIDYANVPWVFRCAPADAHEARLLLGWARERGHRRILVFAEDDRDGRTGCTRLAAAAREESLTLQGPRMFRPHLAAEAVDAASVAAADAVVIWAGPEGGWRLLHALREAGFAGPVLAPAAFLAGGPKAGTDPGEIVVAAPADPSRRDARWRDFRTRYRARAGREPDAVGLLAYDATTLLIAAVERAGLNRARIRDAVAESDHDGVAGTFRFDGLGGSGLAPVLITQRGGVWERVLGGPRAQPGPAKTLGGDGGS